MAEEIFAPFSARNRGPHAQIDNECPETTRIGLMHLVRRLVEIEYVDGWTSVSRELRRIARVRPDDDADFDQLLLELPWERVFDFCERLHGHLTQNVWTYNRDLEERELATQKSEVQQFVANELQRLFLEEHLAFEFTGGLVRRRGRRNTAERITRAELVQGDTRLATARSHFVKALRYFRSVPQFDPENVVKESVCAVEAAARALFPSAGSTLGDIIQSLSGAEAGQLPKAICKTFQGLYGFRNGGEGVAHGGATGGAVTKELAEYVLSVASSQIVLLVDHAALLDVDIPF